MTRGRTGPEIVSSLLTSKVSTFPRHLRFTEEGDCNNATYLGYSASPISTAGLRFGESQLWLLHLSELPLP